ncbi:MULTISPECIES: ABC transporter permease [Bacillus]|uniref:Transport permease protein n=1 Tax=Bacillus subtilis TaxID=1423 RepID=A0A8I1WGZ9_BACIU|nr:MULTISPECIES: ABC transporter permease [Bacillus]MBO3795459.1 ABC transporter permease [Bacillus subtilis]MED3383924.1 ABC transporter permease [Bacillus subtilis]MED3489967.1 ABC transporter permease [Bacillus subtilis]MED3603703.1 ABC transporter permease [Bacillus subtilis]MED3694911.1 ABC transporter permease [Bacillus subtilis]
MSLLKLITFDFMNILRNPVLVIANTAFPFVLILVMGFVTKSSFGAGGVSSYDYYGVNMMIFTAALIAMTTSNTFMEEKVKKANLRIVYAPVSTTSIYLSKLLSTFIFSVIMYSMNVLIAQTIFHLNFGGQYLTYFMLLLYVFLFFGCCFGTMFCSLFKNEEQANGIMQIPIAFFVFFGGVFFGIHRFGDTVNQISILSPIKWVTECSFRLIYDHDFSMLQPVMSGLILASIICIAVSHVVFKPEGYIC